MSERRIQFEHLAAGVSGGIASTLALHPLDLIKVRFQVHEGKFLAAGKRPQYNGIFHALQKIGIHEGIRGLYQGVTPNVWGSGLSWGLYFMFYNEVKSRYQTDNQQALSAGTHMLAAAQAGIATLVLTNPIWVVKTRLCLQYESSGKQYKGMIHCLSSILKHEGVLGLYRGFIPGLLGVSHGALQFMAYEELKKLYTNYRAVPHNTKLTAVEYLSFAVLSKIFAAVTTYPYQVIRSRLQDQHSKYSGIRDVLQKTLRSEGINGLYKGMSPYLLHVTPNICIVFLVYEYLANH